MEYSASMTSRGYLYRETKKVAALIKDGLSLEEIKDKALEENVFQIEREYRRKEVYSAVIARIKNVDDKVIEYLATSSLETAKILVVYIIMKYDRLFFEFVNEVYREKVMLRDLYIRDKDFGIFFQTKREQSEKVNGWSEATFKKLKQVYLKIFLECGIISDLKGDKEIKTPFIDNDVKEYLYSIGDKVYINAILGIND